MRTRAGSATTRWGSRIGLRGRSVLVAVAVVLVALLLGGAGLVLALQSSLERAGEAAARSRAAEIVARISVNGVNATASELPDEARTDAATLIIAADGRLVGSSHRATTAAFSAQRPAVGDDESADLDIDTLDVGGDWEVVTTALRVDGATYYVQVAQSILVQRNVVQTVTVLMLAATPVLLGAVAVAVWVLVGYALRSVERLRASVAEINARELTARLEVPPTGDEIAALATTMNAMLDRLETADRAQRSFVSDASHELRSPLATLSTAAELAARTTDDEARTRLLDTMNAELVRMRGLVANLMALARIDSPDSTATRTDIDLDDLVDHEVQRLRITSRHEVHARVEPVRVRADPPRIAQALRNLVDNADHHAASQIVLALARRDDEAVIWVDNDGPVIDPGSRERIFERFVRLDGARSRDAGGTGLGLAIARASLRSQGGDVVVRDHPLGWCRFEIRVPLAPEDLAVRSPPPRARAAVET